MTVSRSVTLGNVLSMVTTLLGVLGLVWGMSAAYSGAANGIEANAREIGALKSELEGARGAIRQLEISEARTVERYESIRGAIEELKQGQRQANDLLRQISRSPP